MAKWSWEQRAQAINPADWDVRGVADTTFLLVRGCHASEVEQLASLTPGSGRFFGTSDLTRLEKEETFLPEWNTWNAESVAYPTPAQRLLTDFERAFLVSSEHWKWPPEAIGDWFWAKAVGELSRGEPLVVEGEEWADLQRFAAPLEREPAQQWKLGAEPPPVAPLSEEEREWLREAGKLFGAPDFCVLTRDDDGRVRRALELLLWFAELKRRACLQIGSDNEFSQLVWEECRREPDLLARCDAATLRAQLAHCHAIWRGSDAPARDECNCALWLFERGFFPRLLLELARS